MSDAREYLIRKGTLWYRPNRSGYTTSKAEAGRYTKAEADREAAIEPWHMFAFHQDEVPDTSTEEVTITTLTARLAEVERERDEKHLAYTYTDAQLKRSNAAVSAAGAEVARLKAALACAVNYIMAGEPPDSRAVSNLAVALAAVAADCANDECWSLIDAALKDSEHG